MNRDAGYIFLGGLLLFLLVLTVAILLRLVVDPEIREQLDPSPSPVIVTVLPTVPAVALPPTLTSTPVPERLLATPLPPVVILPTEEPTPTLIPVPTLDQGTRVPIQRGMR